MDRPAVNAARRALENNDVSLILPYVKEDSTGDVKSAFEKALEARKAGPTAPADRRVATRRRAVVVECSLARMISPENILSAAHLCRHDWRVDGFPFVMAAGRSRHADFMLARACR